MFSQSSNTEIPNGASETTLTSRRGEVLRVDRGDTIAVIDAPAIVLDNDNSALFNAGSVSTTSPTETVRVDANDINIANQRSGSISAEGTCIEITGASIALQTGDVDGDTVDATIVNRGEIDGRGQADSTSSLAGDDIRIFSGTPDGENEIFKGSISSSGRISSENEQGTIAGIRVTDGVGFSGTIQNVKRGLIKGEQNGLYFGNATHDVIAANFGRIESGSRLI